MKSGGMRRFGVVGAVGAVVSAVLGALIVVAPSASAETAWLCQGRQIELDRCFEVIFNEDYRTVRVRGEMVDRAGGGDFRVWLRDVKVLHETPGGAWEVIRHVPDRDGSFDVKDVARTSTFKPCNYSDGKTYGIPTFRVKVTYYWRGPTDGHSTFFPKRVVTAPWSC